MAQQPPADCMLEYPDLSNFALGDPGKTQGSVLLRSVRMPATSWH